MKLLILATLVSLFLFIFYVVEAQVGKTSKYDKEVLLEFIVRLEKAQRNPYH